MPGPGPYFSSTAGVRDRAIRVADDLVVPLPGLADREIPATQRNSCTGAGGWERGDGKIPPMFTKKYRKIVKVMKQDTQVASVQTYKRYEARSTLFRKQEG